MLCRMLHQTIRQNVDATDEKSWKSLISHCAVPAYGTQDLEHELISFPSITHLSMSGRSHQPCQEWSPLLYKTTSNPSASISVAGRIKESWNQSGDATNFTGYNQRGHGSGCRIVAIARMFSIMLLIESIDAFKFVVNLGSQFTYCAVEIRLRRIRCAVSDNGDINVIVQVMI
jgi:hypothetical protein